LAAPHPAERVRFTAGQRSTSAGRGVRLPVSRIGLDAEDGHLVEPRIEARRVAPSGIGVFQAVSRQRSAVSERSN